MMNSSVTCKNPGHLSRTSSWDIDLDEAHSTCPIRQDRRGQSASLLTRPIDDPSTDRNARCQCQIR